MKRLAALASTFAVTLAFSAASLAQTWPAKPVRVVVPAPATS
jgi:tripartite-type tricarboxylate transporter receptor subunit TctC